VLQPSISENNKHTCNSSPYFSILGKNTLTLSSLFSTAHCDSALFNPITDPGAYPDGRLLQTLSWQARQKSRRRKERLRQKLQRKRAKIVVSLQSDLCFPMGRRWVPRVGFFDPPALPSQNVLPWGWQVRTFVFEFWMGPHLKKTFEFRKYLPEIWAIVLCRFFDISFINGNTCCLS